MRSSSKTKSKNASKKSLKTASKESSKTLSKVKSKTSDKAYNKKPKSPASKRSSKDDTEKYGKIIKNLRIECGLTQSMVAKALGVTPGYISNVENNRAAMSLKVLIYYAKLTGKTLDDIVGLLEPSYTLDSLDKKISQLTSAMTSDEKRRLIKIIELMR